MITRQNQSAKTSTSSTERPHECPSREAGSCMVPFLDPDASQATGRAGNAVLELVKGIASGAAFGRHCSGLAGHGAVQSLGDLHGEPPFG